MKFAELPFMQVEVPLSVCLRLTDAEGTGRAGMVRQMDREGQFEWSISEDDLERVALLLHRLASNPGHEYDRLSVEDGSAVGIQFRMTDVAQWLGVRND